MITDFEATSDNRSAQVIQIDSSKHVTAVAVCAAICGMSSVVAGWAWYKANAAETEHRMVEYYLMDPSYRTPAELEAWAKFKREH